MGSSGSSGTSSSSGDGGGGCADWDGGTPSFTDLAWDYVFGAYTCGPPASCGPNSNDCRGCILTQIASGGPCNDIFLNGVPCGDFHSCLIASNCACLDQACYRSCEPTDAACVAGIKNLGQCIGPPCSAMCGP
jgi:hypothetical protein